MSKGDTEMPESSSPVGDPPEWMNDEAIGIWWYLVRTMGSELQPIDRPLFVLACAQYGAAEIAQKDLHARGPLVKARTKDHSADEVDEDGEVIAPSMVKNPSEAIARQAQTQFLAYAKELGITPASRKRMKIELAKAKVEDKKSLASLIGE